MAKYSRNNDQYLSLGCLQAWTGNGNWTLLSYKLSELQDENTVKNIRKIKIALQEKAQSPSTLIPQL